MALHRIRDPIHGFIVFDDLERDLINSVPYQRLRRIKQLSMTHLVYPGAMHTRFEHALGVMQFATDIFDTLLQKQRADFLSTFRVEEGELERARRVLRISALLHDVGHAPFSHGPEELLGRDHEEVSVQILREIEVRTIIDDRHYTKGIRVEEDIVPVILTGDTGTPRTAMSQLLNEIITGVFGADRIDYLLRDSLHTGVMYGRFDAERLIHTLCLSHDHETGRPILALSRGGVHAAEGLILARYFLFQQVYFHAVRRIYDHHLLEFLRDVLPGGRFPQDAGEYLDWDDARIEQEIDRAAADAGTGHVAASRLRKRRHHKVILDEPRFADFVGQADVIRARLAERFPDDEVHVDFLKKELAKQTELTLPVQDGATVANWEEVSPLFSTLPPLGFLRIYARRDSGNAEEMKALVQNVLDEIRSEGTAA